ncbi:MAG TPA: penicillin-binding transpeptidase domain-containing protein, partial [Acidimicrobiales bacterium]|nr:penicillin-binding transpeptidase domain-containing protein [Acidimicrobiales bacterium]
VRQASTLVNNQYNKMLQPEVDELSLPRGEIISADGVVLARSQPTNDGYGQLRVYPDGLLFAGITGYLDPTAVSVADGLEEQYNSDLEQHTTAATTIRQILDEQSGTDSITLTVSAKLQAQARAALGGRLGAVVAIEPTTGAIEAMYANPTYNPNLLATHDARAANKYYESLDPSSPTSALVNGATALRYPPGSTFKVITTSAIFDHDPKLVKQTFPVESEMALPDSPLSLHNYDYEVCGGKLPTILAVSCDTAYGEAGIELGASSLAAEARSFGIGQAPPIDLPASEVAPSSFATSSQLTSGAYRAYSAIGQFDVAESALENALVASAMADGGTIMTPHLLNKVIGPQGQVVETYQPHPWRQATSKTTASEVRNLMLGVTADSNGTAYGVFPTGLAVAAKTGTAETVLNSGQVDDCSDDWLIATAPAASGQVPKIAVAVVVLGNQPGEICDGTGATVAGPVISEVLSDALADGL